MTRGWLKYLVVVPAFLYLLPTQTLLEESLRQRQKVRTLTVSWKTTLYDEAFPNGEISFNERAQLDTSSSIAVGKLRLDSDYPRAVPAVGAPINRVMVFNGQNIAELPVDGKIKSLVQLPKTEIWWLFYLCHEQQLLSARLNQAFNNGLALENRLLDRLGNRVVYSIGKDATSSRFWFDKDLMQPLGYAVSGNINVRWDETNAYNDETYFPQQILIRNNEGKILEKREVQSVRINQPVNPEQFNVTAYTLGPPRTDAVVGIASEIEKFRARYN